MTNKDNWISARQRVLRRIHAERASLAGGTAAICAFLSFLFLTVAPIAAGIFGVAAIIAMVVAVDQFLRMVGS